MSDAKVQLLRVLQEATSQDYNRMRQAEVQLKQWENAPSFFATLQDIFYDSTVDHDIRFLSGIYLKNGIDRFWRKTAKNPISVEEKTAIRHRLLQFVEEPSKKLTAQNAVIVAKIARVDYPREWPDLLDTMIQNMQLAQHMDDSRGLVANYRILETLVEVLSELSTRLLSFGRKQFAEIAPKIFEAVQHIYAVYVDRHLHEPSNSQQRLNLQQLLISDPNVNNSEALLAELDIVLLCVKCMKILMVNGIKNVHMHDESKIFIEMARNHVEQYMICRFILVSHKINSKLRTDLERNIEEYGNLFISLQKAHPISTALCPAWLDIIQFYWKLVYWEFVKVENNHIIGAMSNADAPQDSPLFHTFPQLQGMLLIKDTIRNFSCTSSGNINLSAADSLSMTEEEKQLVESARELVQKHFLSSEFVNACAETLVSRYMLQTPADSQKWNEDPEGWGIDVDSENWEFELRPCAEMMFMDLLSKYRNQLVPIILGLVENVATVTDKHGLLFKDAVYCVVGLGVHSLYGKLDFESLVMNRLTVELQNKTDDFKILRRRIGWLLGKWAAEGMSSDCREVAYKILLELLGENEDLVVRLTAATGLKEAVEDWDFDIKILVPHLEIFMKLLLELLDKVEESDTIMKLISCLNAVIDRTGSHIIPYANQIIQLLRPMWSESDNPLLRSSLVVVFTKIVAILNDQSVQLHEILLPIVAYCIDRNNEAHIYLLEDSLDLWWTILQTTSNASDAIMSLLPCALELLDYDTESLRKVLKIIDSYIYLNAQATLQPQNTIILFSKLAEKILNSREQAASYVQHTVNLALQSVPLQVYGENLVQSGLLSNILSLLLEDKMYGYAIMNYMNIFARLAIYDANFVINIIQLIGQQQNMSDYFFGEIFKKWLDEFDSISQTRARKLACLGYTKIIMTLNTMVLNNLTVVASIWSSLGSELKEIDGKSILFNEVDMEDDLFAIENSAENNRKSQLLNNDPVYTIDLIQLVRQVLSNPIIVNLTSEIDEVILNELKQVITEKDGE